MSEVRHLAHQLAARIACLGLDELRLVDAVVTRLELGRERYGELDLAAPRDWGKELGEELVDALVYHTARELAAQDLARASLREAARVEMFGGPARAGFRIGMKIVDDQGEEIEPAEVAAFMRGDDLAIAEERAPAEFAPDAHLTRVSTEPARIAATPDASNEPYVELELGGES